MRLLKLSSLFALAAAQQPLPITPPKGTELNDIPILGLGTWYLSGQNGTEAVASAIQNGYRHIDAAWYYKNQEIVGPGIQEGLRRTGLSRKDVWVTSKLWNSQHNDPVGALQETLEQLRLEYVDLFLLHWPQNGRNQFDHVQTYQKMEQLVGKGTRFLGVSNTSPKQLEDIIKVAKVKPKVVQIELHPYLAQTEYVKLIQQKGIAVTAYAPLANTNFAYRVQAQKILAHPTVNAVATARSCTAAQVVLAWNMGRGVAVIPKSAKVAHQKENYASTEKCKLTPEDSAKIDSISATTQFRMLGNACAGGNACWEGLAKGY